MWANKNYMHDISDLCAAGGILDQEGAIAWESLDELAPGNLERDDQRWRWARGQFEERCRGLAQQSGRMIKAELPEDTEFALIVRIPNDPQQRIVTVTNQQEIVAGLAGRWAWTGKPRAT